MADWLTIKTEYITTDTSYRKLAEKYGIPKNRIFATGKRENWALLREQYRDKTVTDTVETISAQEVDRAARIQSVSDKLLDKIEAIVDAGEPVNFTAKAIRELTSAVKDLKEIQGVRSAMDDEEQRVRIENLRKQNQKDDKSKAITVVLEGELKKYAQ